MGLEIIDHLQLVFDVEQEYLDCGQRLPTRSMTSGFIFAVVLRERPLRTMFPRASDQETLGAPRDKGLWQD